MENSQPDRIPLDDLLVFHRLARSLTSSFDLDAILRTILDHMERFIDADLWTLLMLDEPSGELYYAIAAGGEQEALKDLRVRRGQGVAGWVLEHGETLIVADAESDTRVELAAAAQRVRSVIAMPLCGRKGTQGVIEILNPRAEQLSDYMIALLHILADHAAIAIENAHDMAHIQRLTRTDDCTGLFNARYLYEVLERELGRSTPAGPQVSLAFLDLDHFKQVNDLHGHLVGSELLAQTGQRLKELSRPQDLCFRYGGDEFVVLMPETGANAAYTQAVELLSRLMKTQFTVRGKKLRLSASVGVATSQEDGATVHQVIGSADTRMYAVKTRGRGAVLGGG
jgi:diguanylate cyclase (GGDEF)-like protein